MEAWGRALSIQQDHAESAYNLALAHRIAREELDAEKWYAAARSSDAEGVSEFERGNDSLPVLGICPSSMNGNRYLMSPSGSLPLVFSPRETRETAPIIPFGSLFMRPGAGDQVLGFSILTVLLLVLGFGLRHWMNQAWFCLVCGIVSSGKSEREFSALEVCSSCVGRRVKGTLIDPKARFFEAREKERIRDRRAMVHSSRGGMRSSEGIGGRLLFVLVTSVDPGPVSGNPLLFPGERKLGPEPEMFVLLGVILLLNVLSTSKNVGSIPWEHVTAAVVNRMLQAKNRYFGCILRRWHNCIFTGDLIDVIVREGGTGSGRHW